MRKKVILASSSPRRREICESYGLKAQVIKPKIKEKVNFKEGPYEFVMGLSFQKAYSIAKNLKSSELVMASDTIVYFNGEKIGKPKDEEEAFKTLKKLSGKTHKVISGLAIIEAGSNLKIVDYVETLVKFKELSNEKIDAYIKTKEALDKAGSYGIQGYGQLLVEEIKGSYLNVVGFPIERVSDILEEYFNISLI